LILRKAGAAAKGQHRPHRWKTAMTLPPDNLPSDDLPRTAETRGVEERESAMLVIWALLGLLLTILFSLALWS